MLLGVFAAEALDVAAGPHCGAIGVGVATVGFGLTALAGEALEALVAAVGLVVLAALPRVAYLAAGGRPRGCTSSTFPPRRPGSWGGGPDDVRALLATCLVRIEPGQRAGLGRRIVDAYADEEVARILAGSFGTVLRRSLPFHLAQANLSMRSYREIARELR